MSNSMNLNLRCEDCLFVGQPWECGCCHNRDHYRKAVIQVRLIDADALMKEIAKHSYLVKQRDNSTELGMTVYGIQQCVDEQPTAYDVDKVIEKLEPLVTSKMLIAFEESGEIDSKHTIVKRGIDYDKVIDIVKGGGTDDID